MKNSRKKILLNFARTSILLVALTLPIVKLSTSTEAMVVIRHPFNNNTSKPNRTVSANKTMLTNPTDKTNTPIYRYFKEISGINTLEGLNNYFKTNKNDALPTTPTPITKHTDKFSKGIITNSNPVTQPQREFSSDLTNSTNTSNGGSNVNLTTTKNTNLPTTPTPITKHTDKSIKGTIANSNPVTQPQREFSSDLTSGTNTSNEGADVNIATNKNTDPTNTTKPISITVYNDRFSKGTIFHSKHITQPQRGFSSDLTSGKGDGFSLQNNPPTPPNTRPSTPVNNNSSNRSHTSSNNQNTQLSNTTNNIESFDHSSGVNPLVPGFVRKLAASFEPPTDENVGPTSRPIKKVSEGIKNKIKDLNEDSINRVMVKQTEFLGSENDSDIVSNGNTLSKSRKFNRN